MSVFDCTVFRKKKKKASGVPWRWCAVRTPRKDPEKRLGWMRRARAPTSHWLGFACARARTQVTRAGREPIEQRRRPPCWASARSVRTPDLVDHGAQLLTSWAPGPMDRTMHGGTSWPPPPHVHTGCTWADPIGGSSVCWRSNDGVMSFKIRPHLAGARARFSFATCLLQKDY
jgi:hypothetical protein